MKKGFLIQNPDAIKEKICKSKLGSYMQNENISYKTGKRHFQFTPKD